MRTSVSALAFALCAASAAFAQVPEGAPSPASPATSAAAPAPASPAPAAKPESVASEAPRVFLEDVTIVVDGKAEFNGSIEMEFTPLGETGKTFDVSVLAKSGRKDIAKDLHKELTIAAGPLYKVKLSGSEVRVSRAKGAKNFAIVIKKLNAAGVSVLVKKG